MEASTSERGPGHADGMEILKLSDQPPCALHVLRFEKRKPSLHKNHGFENYIGRMLNRLSFNSKFLSDVPQRPSLRNEQKPKQPTRSMMKGS